MIIAVHRTFYRSLTRLLLAPLYAFLMVTSASATGNQEPVRLKIYAASSLTGAFSEIARSFEAAHDNVDIALIFAGSQVLRFQIEQGAPADLFASANPEHTLALQNAQIIRGIQLFATNELAVIVPPQNPARIESYDDLTAARRLVIGTSNVPVGRYARAALRRSIPALGVEFESTVLSRVVSVETNVRLIRARVELGEADAGIVYRTEAITSPRVHVIPIPSDLNVRAEYTIGLIADGNIVQAKQWAGFLLSPEGQSILSKHGFLAP